MARLKFILSVISPVAQMLGLGLAIFLLTPMGRRAISNFGFLPVFATAFSAAFLIGSVAVYLVIRAKQVQSAPVEEQRGDHLQSKTSQSSDANLQSRI